MRRPFQLNPPAQRFRRQPFRIPKHQRLRVVIPHHILIGVPQADDHASRLPVVAALRRRRRRQPRPPVGIIPQRHPRQRRVRSEAPLQFITQIAGEQQPVESGAAGKLRRQTAHRPIGPVGIKHQIIPARQPFRQLLNLVPVIRPVIGRKLPDVIPPQIGNPFIPQRPGVDDGRARRHIVVNPFRCRHRRMGAPVNPGKGDGVQHRCPHHNAHQRHRRRIRPTVGPGRNPLRYAPHALRYVRPMRRPPAAPVAPVAPVTNAPSIPVAPDAPVAAAPNIPVASAAPVAAAIAGPRPALLGGTHRSGQWRRGVPFLRKRRIPLAGQRFVKYRIVPHRGRRGVPFLRKRRIAGRMNCRRHSAPCAARRSVICPASSRPTGLPAGRQPPAIGPGHRRRQHPRRHQYVEGQQREHIPQKLDLKQLQKDEGRRGPRQQQPVGPRRNPAAPGHPQGERRRQPGHNAQRQSQPPNRRLPQLIPEGRRIRILPGERKVARLPRHTRLLAYVPEECRPVQQGIGRRD